MAERFSAGLSRLGRSQEAIANGQPIPVIGGEWGQQHIIAGGVQAMQFGIEDRGCLLRIIGQWQDATT
jgi:hypothetical protein